jgi:tetratricopeptide (TPR) repeat protein
MEKALMVLPDSPYMMTERGSALSAAGRDQEAVEAYGETIAKHPGYYRAYDFLGSLLRETDHFSEADSVYDAACSRWDSSSRVFEGAGHHYMVRGQLDRAEDLYRRAIDIGEYNLVARLGLARCLHQAGREEEAAAEIVKVENEWPPHPPVSVVLASYHRTTTKDLDQAEKWARTHLEMVPDSWLGLMELAYIAYERSRYDEAVSHLQRILENFPRYYSAQRFLAVTQMANGQYETAVETAKSCVEVNRHRTEGWETLGDAYLRNGQRHHAAVAYEQILETSGDKLGRNARALSGLAAIYYLEGRFQMAMSTFRKCVAASVYEGWCWSYIAGIAWDIQGDETEARAACAELMKPARSANYRSRGMEIQALIEKKAGHPSIADSLWVEALAVTSAGLEEDPKNFNLMASVSRLHARLGNEEQARIDLAGFEDEHADSIYGQIILVRILAALDDTTAALDHLEKAIELGLDWTAPLEASRELAPLREDPRFEELISSIR